MSNSVLLIHSSPLGDHSVSRKLTANILAKIGAANPEINVVERDLTVSPLPHLDAVTLGAFATPADQLDDTQSEALVLSNSLIEEVVAADMIVISAPMWNFGIPSVLKAWIDHIVRAGRTFQYGASGPESLLPTGKKVIIVSSRGGVYSAGPMQTMDYQETYLKAVLEFIGLQDISIVRAEGVAMGEDAMQAAMQTADAQLAEVI